jgi:hypothetical protein
MRIEQYGSRSDEAPSCYHSQKPASDQCSEDPLTGLPIDRPQPLCLTQSDAESRHLGVLGLNSAAEFLKAVVSGSGCAKGAGQWHDDLLSGPVAMKSESRRSRACQNESR